MTTRLWTSDRNRRGRRGGGGSGGKTWRGGGRMKERRMQVNDLKNRAGKKKKKNRRAPRGRSGRLCLTHGRIVRVCTSVSCTETDSFFLHKHTCRRSVSAGLRLKLWSIGKLKGSNCSASTHGGPQSLTKSSTINCPILPSRLWNVFLLSCFTFALGPPLLFACIWLIFTDKPPLKTVQLPERKLPLSVCLSVDDLAHCCPRCSGFLFHLSYDYGVLITSLTNDVDWHHYIVVLAGSLGMLIKEADVSLAVQSSRIINMRWSHSLKLEHQTLFTRTLYMMFLFEHWITARREKITARTTMNLTIVQTPQHRFHFFPFSVTFIVFLPPALWTPLRENKTLSQGYHWHLFPLSLKCAVFTRHDSHDSAHQPEDPACQGCICLHFSQFIWLVSDFCVFS